MLATQTRLKANFAPMMEVLSELTDIPEEFRDRLLIVLNSGVQLGRFECHDSAETGELIVAFEPSDSLLELASAVRTRDR